MTATPPQGIDRASLVALLRTQAAWGPTHCQLVADRILALARPVEGVTLPADLVAATAVALRESASVHDAERLPHISDALRALAARLEAAQ